MRKYSFRADYTKIKNNNKFNIGRSLFSKILLVIYTIFLTININIYLSKIKFPIKYCLFPKFLLVFKTFFWDETSLQQKCRIMQIPYGHCGKAAW